jgi:TolB-like protein/Flp pilus assembly protein TadD
VTVPSQAVFLSYASQDAAAALKICEALRAGGIEVWFDQTELRGGDAWDQSIRRQIKNCALFIPVVSRHTHERAEGYFRLEWKLAIDRSHLITSTKAFLLPVAIDETPDDDEQVPDRFRELQWTRLPGGETSPAFVERVQRLLSGKASTPIRAGVESMASPATGGRSPLAGWSRRVPAVVIAVLGLGVVFYLAIERSWISKPAASSPTPTSPVSAAFTPPPHSVAVLPFVNMSGDKEQEYFSDGLTEELLNSLAEINELQVAARTSAFYFKGKDTDLGTIARKLNVGAILEGSVRRSGNTIRITTQLINATTGFHLWSKSYDRDLGDVLKVQTEIATAVAGALKVTLLGDISQRIELGGTRNPAAFDAYLRGRRIGRTASSLEEVEGAITAYTEAIGLDASYALAFAERSIEFSNSSGFVADPGAVHERLDRALADARTATTLAPELAEGYYALGVALSLGLLEFAQANEAYTRALALAPGNARILAAYSRHAAESGHSEAAIDAGRRAIALDPLNFHTHRTVGIALLQARQYPQALTSFQRAISLQPDYVRNHALLGETQYAMGTYEAARKSCEIALADQLGERCLAMTYRKLGRNSDAEAMLRKLKSTEGDAGAWDYAAIYAQWGEAVKALDWLETAVRLRDPSLLGLNREPYFDPLQKEARFQAIVRKLNFSQ